MGPIVEAAVPRRSDELPPPSPSKDVPNDLSLRSLSNFASVSRFFATARKAATSSSDQTIILYLAVSASWSCPSYIFLRCLGPRWSPYQLYHTRSSRPLLATVPAGTKCPENVCTSPTRLTDVYVAPLARLNTAQTPIPSCLHQARYIVLGCGSFVRGRKRKRVDSRPLLYYRVNNLQEKSVETSQYISTNHPVSQSYICQTPSTK